MHSIVANTFFVFINDLFVSYPVIVVAKVDSPPYGAIFVPLPLLVE